MKVIHVAAATALFVSANSLSAQVSQPLADSRVAELDAYVAQAVKDWHAPGLAIAVVKDGRVLLAKGYGVREAGRPAAVDTSTLFAIASTTKAMTAAAMGMLVDEGKVKWDDPVTKYLPSFQLYDPYVLVPDEGFGVYVFANSDHVEVRHALMYKAVDLFLGNPPRDWSHDLLSLYDARRAAADSARLARESRRIKGTKPSLALSKYAGVYEDPLVGRVAVTEREGKLRLEAGHALRGELEHWQYDTFRARYDDRWQGTDMITFTIGDGVASTLGIAGFTLKRVPNPSSPASN
jgi:hypothetical protein